MGTDDTPTSAATRTGTDPTAATHSHALASLRRWEDSGGTWRVVTRSATDAVVSLRTCDGGEEMSRLVAGDPDLLAYLGDRTSNED